MVHEDEVDAHLEQLGHHYAQAASRARAAGGDASLDDGPFGAGCYRGSDRDGIPGLAVKASLGCGNPTEVADLQSGERVLDLGSGAGLDLLLSSRRVGPGGRVYGLDMSEEMLALARQNIREAGVTNIDLLKGHIESIPLPADSTDVVISNCVVNLSTDKRRVFAEIVRVLVPGGRLGISDVVAEPGRGPAGRAVRDDDGTVLGEALPIDLYQAFLRDVGMVDVDITLVREVAPGLHAAIVRGSKPGSLRPGLLPSLEPLRPDHWPDVARILRDGVLSGTATFETTVPEWDKWNEHHLADHRLVARAGEQVVGWAALVPVSNQCVQAGVAETRVYVASEARRQGVGKRLLASLVGQADDAGLWTLEARVFPENAASLALHHACGFRTVGVRERIGQLHNTWRDVVLLERRSPRPDVARSA